jgi:dipeptidyl aminopeptidase/acylaminoacyl peptidase
VHATCGRRREAWINAAAQEEERDQRDDRQGNERHSLDDDACLHDRHPTSRDGSRARRRVATLADMETRRLPTPDVLREQVVLEQQDLAPDASFAIVTRRVVDGEDYVSHLWRVAVPDGGKPQRLTDGRWRDTSPAIRPDGRAVAFCRKAPDEDKVALCVLALDDAEPDAAGAAAEPVTIDLGDLSPSAPAWSPDGQTLAFTAETGPQRFIVGPVPDKGEPRARVITTLDYRWDEQGYLDRRSQAFTVPANPADGSAAPRQLTDLVCGVSDLAWRPDGKALAFSADPRAEADRHPRTSIWEVSTDGGDPREILALAGPVRLPAYSPDSRLIAAVGVDDPDYFDDLAPSLHVAPVDGSAAPVELAPDFDRPVGNWADSDLTGWHVASRPGPVWDTPDGITSLVSDRGRTHPWRFPVHAATGLPAGDPIRLGHGDVMANSVASAGGVVILIATVGNRPPELCIAAADGEIRPITTMGSAWIDSLPWPKMALFEAPGPGGPIEVWLASPAGSGAGPLPTVVDVHGGPLGAWAPAPSMEVVLLCARGYRVVLPNIRGSASYGGEWIRPQLGDWGGADADDVHAALDFVEAMGLADPSRLGVLGLSYGGFMVNWLVGTTDRFVAAVSENGVTNQVSAWAHSDSGAEYCRAARMGDATTPAGVEQLWRQSPLRNVAAVHTPILLLQSEADRRCPPADNEQFFAALRWLGREVEYVLYPEEYHVVQATGRIDRRIDRMTRMLDWFDGHIER